MKLDWRRWAILAGGFTLFLLYAYPGFKSPDSDHQLWQARQGVYGDWHPPMMAWLWHYTDKLISGPLGMLLLQSATFLLGVEGIARRYMSPMKAAFVAVAILLFPPVLTPMAVIWKDSQMAGYLLAATACFMSPRRGWKIAGCVLVVLATGVRHNGLAATLPIVVLLFTWRDTWTGWRRYALSFAVWVAITFTAGRINKALTDSNDYPWHNSVAMFDIAGTVRFSTIRDDAKLRELLEGAPLVVVSDIKAKVEKVYSPNGHYYLTHDNNRVFDLPRLDQMEGVKRAWLRALTTQPRAFLVHRLRVFREALAAGGGPVFGSVWHGDPFPTSTPIQEAWINTMLKLKDTWLFRPWIYLVLLFAVLAMCRSRVVLALTASGLFCELSLLAAAPSPDYRYSHWMIAATLIAAVMTFVERYREGRSRSTSSPALR